MIFSLLLFQSMEANCYPVANSSSGSVFCVICPFNILQWISTLHTRGPNRINAESALQHSHREREHAEAGEKLQTGTIADVCMKND